MNKYFEHLKPIIPGRYYWNNLLGNIYHVTRVTETSIYFYISVNNYNEISVKNTNLSHILWDAAEGYWELNQRLSTHLIAVDNLKIKTNIRLKFLE